MRSLTRRLFASVAVVMALSVAAACQSEQPPRSSTITQREYPTPARPLNLSGQVVFTPGDGSLWMQNANGTNVRVLVKSTGQSYAASPAFSPDGKQVAYAVTAHNQNGNTMTDIRVINLAGKDERVIAASPDNTIRFSSPTWSPDGKGLWFTHTTITGDVTTDEIDRVSITGGTAQRVLDGGQAVTLSPDGKKIAFLRHDDKTDQLSLWVADLDGSHSRQLLDSEAFDDLEGARFSPDSQTLVFAASGAPQKQLPGLEAGRGGTHEVAGSSTAAADACLARFLFTCWVNTAYAHGLPWDLWLVNLDGTKFERLTKVGADSPYPAWSPNGKFIAFIDLSGFYVVNRETKEGHLISINGGHGALDWR